MPRINEWSVIDLTETRSGNFSSSAYLRMHKPTIRDMTQYTTAGMVARSELYMNQYGAKEMDKAFWGIIPHQIK